MIADYYFTDIVDTSTTTSTGCESNTLSTTTSTGCESDTSDTSDRSYTITDIICNEFIPTIIKKEKRNFIVPKTIMLPKKIIIKKVPIKIRNRL